MGIPVGPINVAAPVAQGTGRRWSTRRGRRPAVGQSRWANESRNSGCRLDGVQIAGVGKCHQRSVRRCSQAERSSFGLGRTDLLKRTSGQIDGTGLLRTVDDVDQRVSVSNSCHKSKRKDTVRWNGLAFGYLLWYGLRVRG
jgi:hypothetical protein